MQRSPTPFGASTTAGEISRNFGAWQDRALQEPVVITHHGRPRVVLLAHAEFAALIESSTAASHGERQEGQPSYADFLNLAANLSECLILFDANLRIAFLNQASIFALGEHAEGAIGRSVHEFGAPDQAETLAARLKRTMKTGEPTQFQSRGLLQPHRIFEARVFPHADGAGILYTQTTELADLKQELELVSAEQEALDALGLMSRCSINAMGFFTKANAKFCDFVGFNETQLKDIRLIDVIAPSERHDVGIMLNGLVEGRAERHTVGMNFLTRHQAQGRMQVAATRIRRDGACVGVCLMGVASAEPSA